MSRQQIFGATRNISAIFTRRRNARSSSYLHRAEHRRMWPALLLLGLGLAMALGGEPRLSGVGATGSASGAIQDPVQPAASADDPQSPDEAAQTCTVDCNATVPASGTVGVPVSFQATASASNCSMGPNYSWTFGDGGSSVQQNPNYTYNSTGAFGWTLTVTASGAGGGASTISTIAGGEGELTAATQASFKRLNAIARDPQGRGIYLAANNLSSPQSGEYIYFVNTSNATVTIGGKTFAPGIVRTVAGGGTITDGENNAALDNFLFPIFALAVSNDGNVVFYLDSSAGRVRALNVGMSAVTIGGGNLSPGNVRTLASGFGTQLYGLAVDPVDSAVFVADSTPGAGGNRVHRVVPGTGASSPVVGTGATNPQEGDPFEGNGTQAGSIKLYQPHALAFTAAGELVVADTLHARILRFARTGGVIATSSPVTLLAQIPNEGLRPYPSGLGIIGNNAYVANGNVQTIRQVGGGGSGQLVSGQFLTSCNFATSPISCGDGSSISSATYGFSGQASAPPLASMAADANGLYVIDQSPNNRARVRYLNFSAVSQTLAGVTILANSVQTIVGAGRPADEPLAPPSGPRNFDGGIANAAYLSNPGGVGVDANGNLWIPDSGSGRLRFVNRTAATVTLFPGTPSQQMVAPGLIVSVNNDPSEAGDLVSVNSSALSNPQGVFVTSQGVFIADSTAGPTIPPGFSGQKTGQLKFVNTTGNNVTIFPNAATPIVVPPGFVARVAGCVAAESCPDNGLARTQKFVGMSDVIVASNGDILVTEVGQNAVRRINGMTGAVSTVTTPFSRMTGLGLGPDGRIYITDTQAGNLLRETAAGSGQFVTLASGLGSPRDVAVGADGTAYVTSADTSRVLQVSSAGSVSIFAGSTVGFAGDGGAATSARMRLNISALNIGSGAPVNIQRSVNITTGPGGEIIFLDPGNNRIRRVGGGAAGASCVRSGTITINATNNPVPSITSLSPTQTGVGGTSFSLTINGTGFIPTSVARWNGSNRTTTFISSTQIQMQVLSSDLAAAGAATITVFNGLPGGGTSNGQTFTVTNPLPAITSLSPSSNVAGSGAFTLTVFGTNFVSTSTVNWNGSPRTTTFINSTQLTAAITANDILTAGSANVTVVNPAPGGGASNVQNFTITAQGQGLEADVAPRPNGNGAVTLADWVQVGRFAAGLDVATVGAEFQKADCAPLGTLGNGAITLADWVQAGRFAAGLDSPVPAAGGPTGPPGFAGEAAFAIESAANAPDQVRTVRVVNTTITRGQNGMVSVEFDTLGNENAISFSLTFDIAQLTYVPPAGGNNALLIGMGMPNGSTIIVNENQLNMGRLGFILGAPIGTSIPAGTRQILNLTFMATTTGMGSPTQIGFGNLPIPQELTDANVNILPLPTFVAGSITLVGANNPFPVLTSLLPDTTAAGSPAFTLTVNGSNFINGSVVQWNGQPRTTTFINSTQLTASIPASDVLTAGQATITVFNPAPGGGLSAPLVFTITAAPNPLPSITSLAPNSVNAGSPAFTLTVNGAGFVSNSVVRWNGQNRTTTFINGTQLTAQIPATDVQTAGTAEVTVFNAMPGGGLSNPLTFGINDAPNPTPAITSLNPNTVTAGGAGFNLIVTGTNFVTGSVVRVDGNNRTTTVNSPTQLTAAILASDIAAAGMRNITVFTPMPGGGTSNTVVLTVTQAPTSTVRVVGTTIQRGQQGVVAVELVSTGLENGVSFTLSFNTTELGFVSAAAGTGAAGAQVNVNTTNAASGVLGVTIAQSPNVTFQAGVRQLLTVTFSALQSGMAQSTQVAFSNVPVLSEVVSVSAATLPSTFQAGTVNFSQTPNPVPTITSLNPASVNTGSGAITLTVNGTNFINGTMINLGGTVLTTTFVSATQVTASVPASSLTTAGAFAVTATNPAPGGGTSNQVFFSVIDPSNPSPTITSVNPSTTTAGSGALTLTVNGTNFVNGSSVLFNGLPRPTTFVNSTQLTVQIQASDVASAGTVNIAVVNPQPGGGTSNLFTFTIVNPTPAITVLNPTSATAGGAAFTLVITGTGFTPGTQVRFNGLGRTTTFISTTQVNAQISEADIGGAGTASITAFNPEPGGGLSNAVNLPIVAGGNLPVITMLTPNAALVGGPQFSLRVNGTNFTSASVVRWNGVNRTTTFDGPTQLTAIIPASDIAQAGTAQVTVFIAGVNGGSSNVATFNIQGPNPVPNITNISPNSLAAGSAGFTLTVTGTGFVQGATVQWNGANRTTTFVSATQMTAAIPASDVAAQGTASVRVLNPAPGGGLSNEVLFTITPANPAPVLTSLNPATVFAGGAAFTLQVNGNGFTGVSVIRVNNVNRATAFVNANQLTTQIAAAEIANQGSLTITVFTPAPGGGVSNPLTLTIQGPNPAPVITSLNPAGAVVGGPAFTLTVIGTGFVNGSTVNWNGQPRTTTFINATQLQAQITAADIAQAGNNNVTVVNPAPGGGTSNTFVFSVGAANPAPTLTNLNPASTPARGAAFELTVTGTNFINGAVVEWNGAARVTIFVNSTTLRAQIPASDIVFPGTASITVLNPAPGGGRSAALSFLITNPVPALTSINPNTALVGSGGFTLNLVGMNFIESSVVRWNGQMRTTGFLNATQLTATIPASDLANVGVAQVTVFTPGPGGGESNAVAFTVSAPNPLPVLTALSPNFAIVGGPDFQLTVTGMNFVPGAVVQWNGQARQTTFVNSTTLRALIPRSDISFQGTASITVLNPAPGGGLSLALRFTIGRSLALVNAASFLEGPIGQNSIVAAFGTDLATGTAAAASTPLPMTLLGTSVMVRDANGVERGAGLFAVAAGQVNLLLPPGTSSGTATVTVTSGTGSISIGQVQVNAVGPGVFAANANGQGVAAAQILRVRGDGTFVFEPVAQFNQATQQFIPLPINLGPETDRVFLVLFATGVRGRTAQENVTVQVGGVNIPVLFAGAQPSFFGLDQVNTDQLPRSLAGRGVVNVVLTVDGRTANTVQISIQ